MPCAYVVAQALDVQPSIITAARRTWIPSISSPGHGDVRRAARAVDAVHVDPVFAADDGDVPDRDAARADDDAAAHDCAGARRRGSRGASITSGPWWTPADEVNRRRPRRPRDRRRQRRSCRPRRARRRRPCDRARRRPRRSESAQQREARVGERLGHEPCRRRTAPAPARAAPRRPSARASAISSASSSSPSGSASQPGW